MKRWMKALLCACLAALLLAAGATSALAQPAALPSAGGSIRLNRRTLSLYAGASASLTARVKPAGLAVHFVSSRPQVARVDASGRVTGVAPGRATITASLASGRTAKCRVTVKPATISLNRRTLSLYVGASASLTARVKPAGLTVRFASSQPQVARVDASGRITGAAPGRATITASLANGRTAKCRVTVKPVPVKRVVLSQKRATLQAGKSLTLQASVSPANATNRAVSWTSSRPSVATVSASGVVTAHKAGSATITAKAGGKKASLKLTVTKAPARVPTPPTAQASPYYATLRNLIAQRGLAARTWRASMEASPPYYRSEGLISACCLDLSGDGQDEMAVLYLENSYLDWLEQKAPVLKLALYSLRQNTPYLAHTLTLTDSLSCAALASTDLYAFTKGGRDYLYYEGFYGVEGMSRLYGVLTMSGGKLACATLLYDPGYSDGELLSRIPPSGAITNLDDYCNRRAESGTALYRVEDGRRSGKYASYAAALKGELGQYGLTRFDSARKAQAPAGFRRLCRIAAQMPSYPTIAGTISDYTGLKR